MDNQPDNQIQPVELKKEKKPKKLIKSIEKKLSKKQQKKLQKVLERRKKKKDVSELLEELKSHQLSDDLYSQLTPKFGSQKKGFKRSVDASNEKGESASKIYNSGKKFKFDDLNVSAVPYTLDLEASSDEDELEDDLNENEPKNETDNSDKQLDSVNDSGIILKEDQNKTPVTTELKKSSIDNVKQKEKPFKETPLLQQSKYVHIERTEEVIASRNKLPIITEEFNIMEEIKANPVVIICGETGSGKTTQIPQFLYEHGFAQEKQIVITQPRRVAAIAMSKRVAEEMNLSNDRVSYQIRYEGNTTEHTQIKFVTDGVLMKEMQRDFLLNKYSVVIVDEAHERSIYSDILIGLISRVIKLREKRNNPLRLIIMSATLRVSDFTENRRLFSTPPPVIKIGSRQFPVTVHFSKHTPNDYVKEAFKKVCKIHKEYPEGGILVFLTGRKEVHQLITKLKKVFPERKIIEKDQNDESDKDEQKNQPEIYHNTEDDFLKMEKTKVLSRSKRTKSEMAKKKTLKDLLPEVHLDDVENYGAEGENFSDSDYSDDEQESSATEQKKLLNDPLYCLPLYSMLPEAEQSKVFQPPPEGSRLCVVATNVAETSLTIPGIKYVVDTGKIKNKFFDKYTGISAYLVDWCAKSSADQRAGRSGRTAPGHCFRLYSSAVYNNEFKDFPDAEIIKKPLDDLILQLKSMHIEKVQNFPFPTAPDLSNIEITEKRLLLLGALENRLNTSNLGLKNKRKEDPYTPVISALGKIITTFPVSPRYGKMLAIGLQQGLIDHMITIVACLTVQEIFLHAEPRENSKPSENEEDNLPKEIENEFDDRWKTVYSIRRKWLGRGNSLLLGDVGLMMQATLACEQKNNQATFCEKLAIRHKSMVEIHKLRKQLVKEVSLAFPAYKVSTDLKQVSTPNEEQLKKIRQLLLMGFCDRIARIPPVSETTNTDVLEQKKLKDSYKSVELEQPVFLNEKSALRDLKPSWLVYQEIYESKKLYMRNVVAVEEEWIPIYAQSLCRYSKPLETPPPNYDAETDSVRCTVIPTFGPYGWQLSKAQIEYPDCAEKFKLFARFLLEGKVFTCLSKYVKDYISSPSMICKEWGHLHEHTNLLLAPIVKKKITSKSKMDKEFKEKPSFLLKEFQSWLPQSLHYEVAQNWPPLN